ncbi:alpha/beta fold hydrolase [Arenicella xantha]|uniref:Pimeloyl-ACP methyl ester carboxylesterase n=1 Tax=Arenicella xantha TaxID=644221 RepID=A0A395JJC0_9GAMM|nr:alpha/beta fold hydrolase [Arenicella xantha]RBP48774.1 pimeloyl-ACP methyl ester carboxylesterase [Arenicella xantha]
MSNSSFSSLIYRIIGKPERWHDDYIVDIMQQYLDEADTLDDPDNLMELAAGDQILSKINQGNVALNAFNTLLDKSRFQMIILDDEFNLVYHNRNASALLDYLCEPNAPESIKADLKRLIQQTPISDSANKQNALLALPYYDPNGDHIYLRSIRSQVKDHSSPTLFHILMVLDKSHASQRLNPDLVASYGLTEKEQDVLLRLVHGNSIRQIADAVFVSDNTIKSHLKSLFRKTNTNSQGTLISLILTHESQVLDSYFESDITTASAELNDQNDREIRLSDGHAITYCEYGPADGRPLLVFHSGFGSRLAAPPNAHEICQRLGRRMIIPDRPGIGKTRFIEGHPAQWNAQLNEFIDLLGLQQYDLLGSVIACQLTMSFAAQADQRLNKIILASPVFLNDYEDTKNLTEILAPAARYVRLSPEFAKEIYQLWLKSVTLNLDAHYPAMLETSVGTAEREMFERHGIVKLLTDVFKEGARQSLDGILNEMIFCMTPLHLDTEQFKKPIEIWYGTEDKRITEAGARAICDKFKHATLHIREGYSEHLYYALFEEIIQ